MFLTVSSPICLRVSTSASESDDMENFRGWEPGAGLTCPRSSPLIQRRASLPGANEDVQGYGSAVRRMIRLEKNAAAYAATMQCTLWILSWPHHVRASHAAGAHYHMQVDRKSPMAPWDTHGSKIILCVLK